MNEEAMAQQYLVDYLKSDATLMSLIDNVWLRSKPQSAPLPAVKIDRQDASDLFGVGLYRVWDDLSFLIRGMVKWNGSGDVDWSEVSAIGDRLDTLLHKYQGSSATLEVASWREESYTDETIEGGDLFLHCGGVYRVLAKAL